MTNHDPEPWARFPDGDSGPRFAENNAGNLYWNPRESYETEDPKPWVAWGVRYERRVGSAYFEPRPEYANT